MSQQLSPWLEGAYGWNFGEGGWNSGMDQNLLKFSFLFDRNVDSITAALPPAVNGQAHYLTTDNRLYFAVGTTYFSTPTPKWFTIVDRGTGNFWQFNGTALVQIDSPQQLDSRVDAVELTVSALGTAAFQNTEFFAERSELDVAAATAANYTDALRSDLANANDLAKGPALVGLDATLKYPSGIGKSINSRPLNPADFPWLAKGDGVTDDTAALNACFVYAAANGRFVQMSKTSAGYLTTDTVVVPIGMDLDMAGAVIWYNGPRDRVALRIGEAGVTQGRHNYFNLHVLGEGFTGAAAVTWPSANYVGVRLINLNHSTVSTTYIAGFNKGLSCYSDFLGFAYNKIFLGTHENNQQGVVLETSGTGNTFTNENNFFGGAMQQRSATAMLGDAYGVVFTWDKVSSYRGQNSNRFYGTTFELGSTTTFSRVPVKHEGAGSYNRFIECRSESNDGVFAICDNETAGAILVHSNLYTLSYDDSGATTIKGISEINGAVQNRYESGNPNQRYLASWNSGDIRSLMTSYANNAAHLQGPLHLATTFSAARSRNFSNAGIETYRSEVSIPNGVGVGCLIETDKIKSFILRAATRSGFGGRFYFQCLDSAGVILTDLGGGHPYARSRTPIPFSSAYGGAYGTSSDGQNNVVVTFGPDVSSVRIIVAGGTNPIILKSFDILGIMDQESSSGVTVTSAMKVGSGLNDCETAPVCTAKPDTIGQHGTYVRGERIGNAVAAIGVPSGWVAITNNVAYLAKTWAASTVYINGQLRLSGTSVYVCTTGGTSASSGGPTGTGTAIVDGTVVWDYLGPKAVFGTEANLA